MNRADFIKEVAAQHHMNQRQAYRAVIAVMDTLRLVLAQGDSVEIGGFGSFQITTDLTGARIPTFTGNKVLTRVLNTAAAMTDDTGGTDGTTH